MQCRRSAALEIKLQGDQIHTKIEHNTQHTCVHGERNKFISHRAFRISVTNYSYHKMNIEPTLSVKIIYTARDLFANISQYKQQWTLEWVNSFFFFFWNSTWLIEKSCCTTLKDRVIKKTNWSLPISQMLFSVRTRNTLSLHPTIFIGAPIIHGLF